MCINCKTMEVYQTVDSTETMETIKESALSMVAKGTFTKMKEFAQPDFFEAQYICEECGKVHVLWLHTFMCRTGGEWRIVA